MSQNFTIAITGANGYLGTNTIKAAIERGWTVNAIVRREEAVEIVNALGATPYLIKDFDVHQLENALKACKAVIHFANIVCGSKNQFEKVNIDGLRNVINYDKS